MFGPDYTKLIVPQHADKPHLRALITTLCEPFADIMTANELARDAFDIDSAVGAQLDILGHWIGLSRDLVVPITSPIYFSFDTPGLGFDEGYFAGRFDVTDTTIRMDDDTYRIALKGKIASNAWDGQNATHHEIALHALESLGLSVSVVDNQDMSYFLIIRTATPPVIVELVRQHIIPPKPAGVRLLGIFYGGFPYFAMDHDDAVFAGFDEGSFVLPTL